MLNLIHAELFKLQKSTGAKICFILTCVCAVALVYISHAIAVGNVGSDIGQSASGLTEIVAVSLFGSLLAGILVCTDFETKAIHDAVACGKGRSAVVISKVLIYVLIMALLLLPYVIVTIIGFSTGAEFAKPFGASVFIKILYNEAGLDVTAASIGKIIIVSLITILIHAARLSICIPLAFKIRKPVAIMGIGFAFSAIIDLLIGLLDDIPVLHEIIMATPFSRDFLLMSMDTKTSTLLGAAGTSILFMIIMALVTYLTFKKAEIK